MLPFSREIGAQFLLGRFARNTRISLGTRGTGIPSLESPADPLSNVKSVFSYSLPYTPDFVAFYFAIDLDKLVRGFEALGNYFGRYGLAIDVETHADRIIASRDRFGVLSDRTRRPS